MKNVKTAPIRSLPVRTWHLLLAVGPGIFCIGHTIGTGSVTTMCKTGSMIGMDLLWLLALCCLFMGFLMEAFGRYAVVTGQTAIYSFKKHLPWGRAIAILVIAGVVLAQYGACMGILGLCSSMIVEVIRENAADSILSSYAARLLVAVLIAAFLYGLLLVGRYSFFEKVLVFFVTVMCIVFLVSMVMVLPGPRVFIRGLIPRLPQVKGSFVLVPAMVGTTMAAATFVVRPLLMKAKGWTIEHRKAQTRDSCTAALLMFVISVAVMASAMGVMFEKGQVVEKVMDMVEAMEPAAGNLARVFFFAGALGAGLSSLFPIIMIAPLLIADYRNGKMETNTPMFRILCAIACLVGLTVPILGFNPIQAQIVTQIGGVFVLPLSIGAMIYLVNRKDLMGPYRAGWVLNMGLLMSFLFSIYITYTGYIAIAERLRHLLESRV
ncbi:MAG: divalent metal cation transporter [Phycisphaerales bacterium]|nr:MAG: divalent metal cation transporter [Phycisphaerales bacterium]